MFHVSEQHKQQALSAYRQSQVDKPTLKFALGFFELGSGFAATLHHANDNGSLGIGSPISGREVAHYVNSLLSDTQNKSSGWIDKRVVFENNKIVAWISQPRKTPMWFKFNGYANVRRLNVHWPRLLFIADKNSSSLRVFAVAKASVDANTKVYHAPLANISSNGVVCQGSAKAPQYEGITNAEFLGGCEAVMYDSNFTHVNHEQTFRAKGDVDSKDHLKKWQQIEKEQRKVRASDLVFTGKRLGQVIEGAL